MTPDAFRKLIQTIGNLITKQAETSEIKIMSHVSKVVNETVAKAEERIINHVHDDIEASEERTREEILESRTEAKKDNLRLLGKLDKITTRVRNLEEKTETPDPHKN